MYPQHVCILYFRDGKVSVCPCRVGSVWCPYLCFLDSISSGAVYEMGVTKAHAWKFLFDKTNRIQQQQH